MRIKRLVKDIPLEKSMTFIGCTNNDNLNGNRVADFVIVPFLDRWLLQIFEGNGFSNYYSPALSEAFPRAGSMVEDGERKNRHSYFNSYEEAYEYLEEGFALMDIAILEIVRKGKEVKLEEERRKTLSKGFTYIAKPIAYQEVSEVEEIRI